MSLTIKLKVGKKNALYIPKQIAQQSGIKEGAMVIMMMKKNKLVIEVVEDPITLALKSIKYAKITFDESEKVSEEEQSKYDACNS